MRKVVVRKALGRLACLPSAAAIAASLVFGSMLLQVPVVRAASAADADAREVTRLINVARAAAGKHVLNVDVFLTSIASDGPIPCPDDPNKTISGRAQDFAAYGQMSHQLRLCDTAGYALSDTHFVSTLQTAWGYGAVGEILLVNGGYGQGEFLYTFDGVSTWTYATTGQAMLGWATSSSHWNIVMGSYDRVGCGAWTSGGTTIWYACLFAGGGPVPDGVAAAPARSPFDDPLPTSAPTAAPTTAPTPTLTSTRTAAPATPKPAKPKPVATATPVTVATAAPETSGTPEVEVFGDGATFVPIGAPSGSGAATDGPVTSSSAPAMEVYSATFIPGSATPDALTPDARPSGQATPEPLAAGAADPGGGSPTSAGQSLVLAAASVAAWLMLFALFLIQRRRRLHSSPAQAR